MTLPSDVMNQYQIILANMSMSIPEGAPDTFRCRVLYNEVAK